jgi:solute carrier family 25 (mitochondrial uncoupling protein), member 8/9
VIPPELVMEAWSEFVAAAFASCIAEFLTLPLDTVKVRIQLQGSKLSTWQVVKNMWEEEGITSFFQGLEPGLWRQTIYGGFRFFMYFKLQMIIDEWYPSWSVMLRKVISGFLAGLISSGVCNPLDLVKLRMQAARGAFVKKDDDASQFQYANTIDAFIKIWRSEGFMGLYQGVFPTMGRASVLASVELSFYDVIKSWVLLEFNVPDTFAVHASAGLLTSLCSAAASNPFDMVKSRLMNQHRKAGKYSGVIDCFVKSVQSEGVFVLWSGLLAYFLRLGPNTILTFVFLEIIRLMLSNFLK